MSQTLKLTGLEEGGLLTSTLLDEYNSLKTNAAKRRLMLDVLRNGYALEKMGLGPVIELLERTDGENFLKLSDKDRLRRLMTMIGALLGETPAAQPPAPVAALQPQPDVSPPAPVPSQAAPQEEVPPAGGDSEVEEANEPVETVITRNEEENSTRRVEQVRPVPAGAAKLRGSSRPPQRN